MTIWIVNPYGTLPSEGWREYRSAMLARALVRRGHDVQWWISDFEHRSKSRRSREYSDPLLPPGVHIEMVPTKAYRRNISFGRIQYEHSFGKGFARIAATVQRPALIVVADPSLFFAGPIVAYAKLHDIPFILDVLDLWPEMFETLAPPALAGVVTALFGPLYRRRDRVVEQASAIVAVTADYLNAVLPARYATKPNMVAYLGVDPDTFSVPQYDAGMSGPLEIVYAGTLGDAYDMPAILLCMEQAVKSGNRFRFTIAGDGPWHHQVRLLADRYPGSIRFLGSVPASDLARYYAGAQVGLATYAAGSTVSMPVKFFDYMAAGLATVGSMGGEAGILVERGAGLQYQAGDPASLLKQLDRLYDDRVALGDMRRFARSLSLKFDQKMQHDRFAALIDEVLAGPKL